VSALPDTGLVRVLGTDFPLGSNVQKKSDWNVFGLAQIGHDYDFQNQRGDLLETRFTGYGTRQFQLTQLDLGFLEGSIGPRLALAPDLVPGVTIKPYVIGSLSWVGGSNYLNSGGAGIALKVPLTQAWTFQPAFEWRRLSVNNPGFFSAAALGSGDIFAVSFASVYSWNDRITLESRSGLARTNAQNPWQSFQQSSYEGAIRIELDPPSALIARRWTVMPFARIAKTEFDVANPSIDPLTRRSDWDYHAGVLLDMPFTATFSVTAVCKYARTSSNIPNYNMKNLSFWIGPTARF
jgi:hypothetical protein